MEMSRKQRRAPLWPAAILVVAASSTTRQSSLHCFTTRAFQPSPAFIIQPQGGGRRKHPVPPQKRRACSLWSSVGDDDDGPPRKPPPPGGGGDGGGRRSNGGWDDFLNADPNESDNLRRAREYMSENSLPISFGRSEEGGAEDTARGEEEEAATDQEEAVSASEQGAASSSSSSSSSALVGPETTPNDTGSGLMQAPSPEMLANNPYMAVVSKLSPSELISKFTSNAHPRVQNAVRSTILGLIGGLPKLAFDTTTMTTGQRLASLMFQLQMTGYMFKNAEYRLSLQQSLGQLSDGLLLEGGSLDDPLDADRTDPLAGKIRGKLRIHLTGGPKLEEEKNDDDNATTTTTAVSADGGGVEVDAAAYLSELRSEVSQLREDLMITRKEKEDALRKDLLTYIRTLPEQELRSLTNTMSQDVLVAMKGLVNAVLTGIGEGQIGAETVTEQSGEAMAQLCMWQLVIGYNLRTLEVREEMKKSLLSGVTWDPSKEDPGGIDTSDPGSLQ